MNELTDKSFLNELLGQTSFNGIGIDVADMIEGERPPEAIEGPDGQMYANNVSIGPDGTWVSNPDLSEPVYFYTQGLELGDARGNYFDVNDGVVEQQGYWRTEAEIKEQWDADEGMGYFQQENPNLDFDTYMDFISESTALYNEGGAYAENAGAYQALAGEYGIATSYQNDDGDVFEFNGSNFTKTSKVDDSVDVGGMIMSIAVSAMTAGALAGPITAMLGSAGITGTAATAATKAITSMVTQLATTGELDLKQALISAAMSYGGDKLGEAFASSAELDGAVGSITSKATETFDKMKGFIETGHSVADAAIKAGGMSLLTQVVSTGEVDLEQALMSAAIAGGTQGLMDLKTNVVEAGVAAPEEVDEFMADLDEFEEFQQEAMTADIKDPFLNPNYTEVADGLMTNSAGEIFNYAGDAIGSMSDLDLDGDGVLNTEEQSLTNKAIDLNTDGSSEAADDGKYYDRLGNVYDENPYTKDGARVYLDSDGNVYTQDQLGGYVEGSEYGDIHMIDGQEVLLEQGTMINGRMMFDGDGDGRFDVVYNENGRVVAQYDSELQDWVDHNGNTSTSIGKYMNDINPLTGASESGIENPFEMSREAYEAMTGEEYVDDLFALKASPGGSGTDGMLLALDDGEIAEMVARFEKHPYADPDTGDLLYGLEGLEHYLQDKDVGVNYSSEHGWRLETGIDTSDGIYGTMNDNHSVADFEGAPDTTKDSTIRTIADIKPNAPINDDPFTDPVEPEPVEPEEVIKEIEEKYTKEESNDPGGEDGADNTQPIDTSGSNSNNSANSTPNSASSSSSSVDAAALAAAYAAAGKPNPHEGTGGPLDPVANPVETSDLPANTTDDSDVSAIDPTDGLGDPVPPTTNSRIEEMMATGMTYEEAVANQNAAIQAGADANSDGMVTNEEWSLFSGNSATGDSNNQDATDTTDLTGGNGTSDNVTTGTGTNNDSTVGSGTEADNTGSTGTGTTGDTGDVSQGTNPTGSTIGTGPTTGTTQGPGGPGDGPGLGGNGDGGMMSGGGDYTPQWGELFAYTTLTPYQKKALAPQVDYIKAGRGMLS